MTQSLDLETRLGLPDALRVLLETCPRQMWEHHENFGGLVAFWMDRHMGFRKMCDGLIQDAERAVDKKMSLDTYRRNLVRRGSTLLQHLHGHHQIEDMQYFPMLQKMDRRLEAGFALLDRDHHALHEHLDRFADTANGVVQGKIDPGVFRDRVLAFQSLLVRHLEDEEDLVVPVILTHWPEASV